MQVINHLVNSVGGLSTELKAKKSEGKRMATMRQTGNSRGQKKHKAGNREPCFLCTCNLCQLLPPWKMFTISGSQFPHLNERTELGHF